VPTRASATRKSLTIAPCTSLAYACLPDDSLLRGLSGGEIKRTSVATELVANPRFLFLDGECLCLYVPTRRACLVAEPTSGLDSVLALAAMQPLKQLTTTAVSESERRTVIVAIHQPSAQVYGLLDHLILMKYEGLLSPVTTDRAFACTGRVASSTAGPARPCSRRLVRNPHHET
jgi:ABC-type multidrug transport system ATPase subunit